MTVKPSNNRVYFLDPFGCAKNQVDAENMMAHLNNAGWENAADAGLADLIIVNSCGFIESAKQESINAVLEWRKLYPGKKILLAGCLSQRYAKELPEILTEADAFIGVVDPARIVEISELISHGGTEAQKTQRKEWENVKDIFSGERPLLSLPGSAYVKISDGCNNRCSYCAIPLIRGSLVSRTIPDILEECRALLARGIKELCIIGQDIGAYGMDFSKEKRIGESKLAELLQAISTLKGHFWVRLLYIHPDHFPLQVLNLMEKDTRFLPYFDIPFQHASTKILTAMNRCQENNFEEPHTEARRHEEKKRGKKTHADKYLKLIKTIRSRLPSAVIRSTFLLGFPGETEEDFAALIDFQEKAGLDWVGCFVYSREEGTAAYSMKKRVPVKIAEARKQTIEERQVPITEKNMDRFIGQTLDMLVEEQITIDTPPAADEKALRVGRLYCQAPDIDGIAVIVSSGKTARPGAFVRCKVAARQGFNMEVQV